MAIHRNSQKVSKRYRGTQEILASYRGDQQFYSSAPALISSAPDYWYTLDYNDSPYKSYGSRSTVLTFASGSFHSRGGHAWVAGAKSKINVQESWSDAKWSASVWLEETGSPTKVETLFSRGVTPGGPLISVWTDGSNKLNLDIGENPLHTYPSTATVPASGWYHLAVTCEMDNGRNKVTIYVNGVPVEQVVASSAGIPSFSPSHYVTFANHANPSSNFDFDGNIDDIALWSRTLSPGEVSAIYQGGRGVVPPEPSLPVGTITVTPQAPTFLTASPWYTLPTQAGVTYTVSGTPGYSQWVTVTATPQTGYALTGQTSWTHTYAAYQEEVVRYTSVGIISAAVPSWCKEIDFILLGGGGGGYRGNSGNGSGGQGGSPGQYFSGSAGFPYGSIKVQVASGGNGTTGTNFNNTDGGATRILGPNDEQVGSVQGGARGGGYGTAETSGPGNRSHAGLTISGGAGAAINQPGGSPGAGGGGGSGGFFGAFNTGKPGGRGEAIIRFRSGPRP